MLRYLAGARPGLEIGMMLGKGVREEGALAKPDLAQPTGWGPETEDGMWASSGPPASLGEKASASHFGRSEMVHTGRSAVFARPSLPRNQESGAARN